MNSITNDEFIHFKRQSEASSPMCSNVDENAIVDAFLEGDVEKISKLHQGYADLKWYKHVNKGSYQKVNLVKSGLMKTILETKVDLLWRNVKTDSPYFDAIFIRNLERELQKYGEVLVKFDIVNGEFAHRFIHDNFKVIKDNYDTVRQIINTEYYNYDDKNYMLEQTYMGTTEYNKLYEYRGGSDWVQVPLSTIPDIGDAYDPVREYKFEPIHRFTNERNLKDVIPLVNSVDMNLSNIDYIQLRGVPFMLLPQELAMRNMKDSRKPVDLDEQNVEYQLTDMRNFIVKNDYKGQDYQKPEFIQPEINLTPYIEAINNFTTISANVMGLADISLGAGSSTIGANTSAEAVRERENLSLRTKKSERSQRIKDLEKMFKKIDETIKIDISDDEDSFDNDLFQAYWILYTSGVIDKQTLLTNTVKPYWTTADHMDVEDKVIREKLTGVAFDRSGV